MGVVWKRGKMGVNFRDGFVTAMLVGDKRVRFVFRSEVEVQRDRTRKREGRGSIGYVENRQRSDLNEGMAVVLKSQVFEIRSRRDREFGGSPRLAI
jgi:hypothetical protein